MSWTKDTSHNLKAYGVEGDLLFTRRVKNEYEARKEVLNNPMVYKVSKVTYKKKTFEVTKIYAMIPVQKQYNNQES